MATTMSSTDFSFNFNDTDDADITCPPIDVYDLLITNVGEMENRAGYKATEDAEDTTDTQNKIEFQIINTGDEWEGFIFSDYFTWGRLYHKSGKETQVWKADGTRGHQAKSNKLLQAVLGGPWKPGISFNPMTWRGERVRGKVEPNKKGYPRVTDFMPPKANKGRTSTVTAPTNGHVANVLGDDGPATAMQLAKILSKWESKGLGDETALNRYFAGQYNTPIDDATKGQAKEFIDHLDNLEIPDF